MKKHKPIDWRQTLSLGRRLIAASRLLQAAQEHSKKKHMRWFMDQALRAIHGTHYEEYIEDFELQVGQNSYDAGVPPEDPSSIAQELGFYELFARQQDASKAKFRSARRP